jgi:hypothetical protein
MNGKHRAFTTSADCLLHDHHWHATFEQGSLLCTVCGRKAYCPGCSLHTVQTLRSASKLGVKLVYCADCRLRQTEATTEGAP